MLRLLHKPRQLWDPRHGSVCPTGRYDAQRTGHLTRLTSTTVTRGGSGTALMNPHCLSPHTQACPDCTPQIIVQIQSSLLLSHTTVKYFVHTYQSIKLRELTVVVRSVGAPCLGSHLAAARFHGCASRHTPREHCPPI